MNLGDRISSLRKTKRWTQARLAEESGLSASAIAMYETNRRHPDGKALDKLAQALGITLDALVGDSEPEESVPTKHFVEQTEPVSNAPHSGGFTQLALSREEARYILFLRMNPRAKSFFDMYITADELKRQQLEKTMRLIQDFQP